MNLRILSDPMDTFDETSETFNVHTVKAEPIIDIKMEPAYVSIEFLSLHIQCHPIWNNILFVDILN